MHSQATHLLFWLVSLQCLQAQIVPSLLPLTSNSLVTLSSSESSLASTTSARQTDITAFTTTTAAVTAIVGLTHSTTFNANTTTATTSASPIPSNSRRCNGYVEFCERKFSNISMVVAHNSPFVRPHNVASNQLYPVLNQLNDGIRGRKLKRNTPNKPLTNQFLPQSKSKPTNPTPPPQSASATHPAPSSTPAP